MRFISADTIVPDPKDPQTLNRYAYGLNNPLRYVDPSGHDPLDKEWVQAFEAYHHRAPDSRDRLIRLFSIAFPDEWDWSRFYTADGNQRDEATIRSIFNTAGNGRNWTNMPDNLTRLAAWYTPYENDAFVRDVGTLFGGLPDRFDETNIIEATTNLSGKRKFFPSDFWARLKQEGLHPWLIDDADGNVHHWAWSFALGYFYGPIGGAMNFGHEVNGFWSPQGCTSSCWSDISLGSRGVLLGMDVAFFGHSDDTLRRLWRLDVLMEYTP